MNEQVEMFKGLLAEHLGESSGDRSIAQMREGYEALGSALPPGDDWLCETVSAGGIPGELSHCGGAARNTVLYLHGGGYVIGSLVTHRGLVANIGRATAGRVLAIDYRLARRSILFQLRSRTPSPPIVGCWRTITTRAVL